MRIGFIGMGKLGLPVSVAIAEKGHAIYGFDVKREAVELYRQGVCQFYEPDISNKLKAVLPRMNFVDSVDEVVTNSEIIFIAVATPHPPELDGSVRHNHVRKDFDYTILTGASKEVARSIAKVRGKEHKIVAIISTVLPGTTRNVIYPVMSKIISKPLSQGWGLCYNPSFIAMGQTIKDFVAPEFGLIGREDIDVRSGEKLAQFYETMHNSPKLRMTWDEAETVKMTYNTMIGFKIIFANTVMEICHKTGADCDVVADALSQATDRLISPRYLRGGMGDGGACHPRDNLALSYLSDKLGLNYNLFDFIMTVRERQTEWLADLMCQYNLPKVILGKTFKPDTNLIDGSPNILLANIIKERGDEVTFYDPVTDPELPPRVPSVYLIGTRWDVFKDFDFVPGSVVIDPWRMIENTPEGVEVISIGKRRSHNPT